MESKRRKSSSLRGWFGAAAAKVSAATGSVWAFGTALLIIVSWAVTGPIFGFSDTWQLVINTGTTIVTFLMVFLIQNTQNRDGRATQVKLDELIRAVADARNQFIGEEEESEERIEQDKRDVEGAKAEPGPARADETAPREASHNGQPH